MAIKLLQGNCLDRMNEIEDGSVDMVMADPPYGTTACKWDSIIDLDKMWVHLKRVIKKNGAIALMGDEPFSSYLRMSNIKEYKYDWVWVKNKPTGAFHAKEMPMKASENILIFGRNKVNFYPIMTKRTEKEFKDCYRKNDSKSWGNNFQNQKNNLIIRKPKNEQWYKCPTNILNIKKDDKRDGSQHPSQKPVELMEYMIKTYTNEVETVLDFCMGSGTTGEACKNLNRNFIGIELDETYFEMAKKRIDGIQEKLWA